MSTNSPNAVGLVVSEWDSRIQLGLQQELLDGELPSSSNNVGERLLWAPENDLEAARDFISAKKGSPATERRYTREIYRFFLWMQHADIKHLQRMQPAHIEAYLNFCMAPPEAWCGNTGGHMSINAPLWRPFKKRIKRADPQHSSKPSVSTIQNTLSILKSFFSFMLNNGYLRGDPTRSLAGSFRPSIMAAAAAKGAQSQGGSGSNYPCRPAAISGGLSLLQWQCLRDTIEEMPKETSIQLLKYNRARFVVHLLYYAGLRSEEARTHSHAALRYDGHRSCLAMHIYGKGSKKRIIPIHPILEEEIWRYRTFLQLPGFLVQGDALPLFPRYKAIDPVTGRPNSGMSERGAEEWMKSLYRKAEKRMKERHNEDRLKSSISFNKATLHTLRHTRAQHMLFHENVDMRLVQAFLGHEKILTTQVYTNPSLEELLATMRQ